MWFRIVVPRTGRRCWLLAVAVSLAYGALLVFLRGAPSLQSDAGIFLSVAARLLHGDRLYADVFDNKDPLFFYVHAAALKVGGWRAPFLMDVLWLAVSAISIARLLRAVGMAKATAVISFIVYPVLLTGTWYDSGYSMLAALALAPLIGWLWAIGRWRSAGATLCVALLFKISLVLVLVAAPLVLLALRRPGGSVREPLVKSGSAFGAALIVAAIFLAARGELMSYLSMLRENVSYANDVFVNAGQEGGLEGHVHAAAGNTPHFWLVVVLFALSGLLACWKLAKVRRGGASATPETLLAGLFLVVSGAVAMTLALTAVWNHHMQMLAYPGTLLVAFLVGSVSAAQWTPISRLVAACACSAVGIILLGGTGNQHGPASPLSRWWSEPHSYTAQALESARTNQGASGAVSYAHLGGNDEDGHAAFLDDSFELACPRFHQYSFTPDLDAVLRCIEDQGPELVVVTPSFSHRIEAPLRWNEWVARGQALLEYEYTLAYELDRPTELDRPAGSIEVWLRRS
jgi:hypothetical protein